MVEAVFFGIANKQASPEIFIQIIDPINSLVNSFINNPLFVEYGKLDLFANGVFSTFIPCPPELTAISLVLAGNSRRLIDNTCNKLDIGAALGYYAGLLSGQKLADIFKVRRREIQKPTEDDRDNVSIHHHDFVF